MTTLGRKTALAALLWALAGPLAAQEAPIGEKVRLILRSGEEIVGVLKSSNDAEIEVETSEGVRTVPSSDVEKAVVLEDEGVTFVQQSQDKAGPHQVEAFSVGLGWGASLEILSYEYMVKNKWGFKVSPLNMAYRKENNEVGDDTETINYAPLWLRRHFGRGQDVWPFVGLGFAFRQSSHLPGASETERKMGAAAEVGLNLSGWIPRLSTSVKYFPGPDKARTVTFNVGWALGPRKTPVPVP